MDFDAFFASPRWEILQLIAEKPSSPVEIAEKLNTTVSYISQQLKLIDAAGIVVKKRTGAAERGKPRALFSLSKDFLYITALIPGFSQKMMINTDYHHKIILKIWSLEDSSLHYYLEKFFWKIEEDLDEINGIYVNTKEISPEIIVVSDSKKLKSKIDSIIKKFDRKFNQSFISPSQFKKASTEFLFSLHEKDNIEQKLKGGKNNNE